MSKKNTNEFDIKYLKPKKTKALLSFELKHRKEIFQIRAFQTLEEKIQTRQRSSVRLTSARASKITENPKKIYIDTCCLIPFFSRKSNEREKRSKIQSVFQRLKEFKNIKFYISYWTLTEMVNVLISSHGMKTKRVHELENKLLHTGSLGELKLQIIDVSPKGNYSIRDFLYEVRIRILKAHPGVGDAMHGVIMKNNKIKVVLTFNTKDYAKIPNITVLSPDDVHNGKVAKLAIQ